LGQVEVYQLLKDMRESGDDRFFSVNEICKLMKNKGYTDGVIEGLRKHLLKLYYAGYLEDKMTNKYSNWKRLFRIKEKYVKRLKEW
jgi:DNA-binding transcriptional ArsR family regulator